MKDSEPSRLSKFLFPSIYKEGNDDADEMPIKGMRLYLFVLKNHFFRLIGVSLLSAFIMLPIVTIPATLTAISRVCMKLCLDGFCSIYTEFFREWKTALLRTLPFGLLTGIPALACLFVFYLGLSGQGIGSGFLIIAGIVLLLLFLLTSYAYPLFALIDLPTATNAKNALLLLGSQLRANIRLLIPLVVLALLLLTLPLSLPMLLILYVPGPALMRAVIVKPPIETLIIKPFLSQNGQDSQSDPSTRT